MNRDEVPSNITKVVSSCTLPRIEGSRSTITWLLAVEITIILMLSGLVSTFVLVIVDQYSDDLVRRLLIG